jgi:hypothetical protein
VAYAILFSLFERAFLMFSNQADNFRKRQWSGWKRFLDDFIRRESVRAAWHLSKETYDTDFQAFMERKIGAMLPKPVLMAAAPLTATLVQEAPHVNGSQSSRANSAMEKRLEEENGARALESPEPAR